MIVECDHFGCHARFRVPDSLLGKKITCPECGYTFTVTSPAYMENNEFNYYDKSGTIHQTQTSIETEMIESKETIKKIVILMNERPISNEALIVHEILSSMKVKGKPYNQQVSKDTVLRTYKAGDIDFNDQPFVLGVLLIAWLQMFNSPPPVDSLTLAPFESSSGIRGNVVAEW